MAAMRKLLRCEKGVAYLLVNLTLNKENRYIVPDSTHCQKGTHNIKRNDRKRKDGASRGCLSEKELL